MLLRLSFPINRLPESTIGKCETKMEMGKEGERKICKGAHISIPITTRAIIATPFSYTIP